LATSVGRDVCRVTDRVHSEQLSEV
jgi:hypothetical protein